MPPTKFINHDRFVENQTPKSSVQVKPSMFCKPFLVCVISEVPFHDSLPCLRVTPVSPRGHYNTLYTLNRIRNSFIHTIAKLMFRSIKKSKTERQIARKELPRHEVVNVYSFLARSAVFEAESEGESEKSEDLQEGSCPVLNDDTEAERVSASHLPCLNYSDFVVCYRILKQL